MNDLISRAELFNRLAPVKTIGEAFEVIQDMPTAYTDTEIQKMQEMEQAQLDAVVKLTMEEVVRCEYAGTLSVTANVDPENIKRILLTEAGTKYCGMYYADGEPTIEPKTGKWIWYTGDRYRCSACDRITKVFEFQGVPMYAYCPRCGARMEEKR